MKDEGTGSSWWYTCDTSPENVDLSPGKADMLKNGKHWAGNNRVNVWKISDSKTVAYPFHSYQVPFSILLFHDYEIICVHVFLKALKTMDVF